ncbi:MAG: HK97 family phage prohead protease [Bacteroidetes bacterium]|nr:HK97 family phage prohead protease [Bacteroidota bacterium]
MSKSKQEVNKSENLFNAVLNIDKNAINSDNKTIEVILCDETKVVRYSWDFGYYDLILEHTKESVNLERADILPLLVQHDTYSLPIGKWENVRVEDGKLKGTAVFDSKDEQAMEIFGKFERGFMKSFSIGIGSIEKIQTQELNENGRKEFKAIKWSLQECSVVTIPANENAKVGLNIENNHNENNKEENNKDLCYNKPNQKQEIKMTREELQAKHPDVYASILASGKASETDRVLAHITMAKSTGANEYALECIEKGEGLTQVAQAKYMSFGMNLNQVENRKDENLENLDTPPEDTKATEEKLRDEKVAEALSVDIKKIDGGA